MDTDLDTLGTALYVMTDDLLRAHPEHLPARPKGSFEPHTNDAELLTLAVMQAVLGYPSETRWLRYPHQHLRPLTSTPVVDLSSPVLRPMGCVSSTS